MVTDNHNRHNTNPDDDFKDEAFIECIRTIMRIERNREKTLVLLPDAMKKITNTVSAIKHLLSPNEYTLKIERNDIFAKDLTIIVETDGFGVAPVNFEIFKEVVNNINSFTISAMLTEKTRIYFGLRNVFTEV